MRKAFDEPGGSGGSSRDGVRERLRRTRDVVADNVPVGADSLELRIRRAHESLEDARQAESDAIETAQWAKDVAHEAEETAQEGRRRRAQAKRTATPS